jgi:membrane fusion protein (multidrug efflux system)
MPMQLVDVEHLFGGERLVFYYVSENRVDFRELVKSLAGRFKMRIEMRGYHYAYREVTIDSIGDQVVGPAEIRRYLPKEIADTLPISGPVVLVTARLPSRSFEAQGKTYDYFDGMQGQAEARVGSETIIATLIPGLRGAF